MLKLASNCLCIINSVMKCTKLKSMSGFVMENVQQYLHFMVGLPGLTTGHLDQTTIGSVIIRKSVVANI